MSSRITIRDRIVELRRVPVEQLVPDDDNFRAHPDEQRRAMEAMLGEIGFAGAVLARVDEEGTVRVIDGHLRRETVPAGTLVPTLILDVTAEEAKALLALYDPLGDMARVDKERIQGTLEQVSVGSDALNVLLLELAGQGRELTLDEREESAKTGGAGPPAMELRPYEHYDYVVVLARSTMDWQALCARLGIERVDSSPAPTVRKIGIGRCVDAARVLELLRDPAE